MFLDEGEIIFGEVAGLGFAPLGGGSFKFFDGFGDSGGAGEVVENGDVVLDGVCEDDRAVDCFADGLMSLGDDSCVL